MQHACGISVWRCRWPWLVDKVRQRQQERPKGKKQKNKTIGLRKGISIAIVSWLIAVIAAVTFVVAVPCYLCGAIVASSLHATQMYYVWTHVWGEVNSLWFATIRFALPDFFFSLAPLASRCSVVCFVVAVLLAFWQSYLMSSIECGASVIFFLYFRNLFCVSPFWLLCPVAVPFPGYNK